MFKKWCNQQKFNNATNLSHVLMDGGVLSVPFDRLNEFHEKYITAVKSGENLFVVEQKSPTYNFFVDIDYKDENSLTLDEIQDICKIICDKVKRHGGKECLISVSPPKKVDKYTKTGVHLNWPGFVVDQASALALREHILVALSKAKGNTDWNEIIDSAVYGDLKRKTKGSGFRMPWSHKMAKHMACGGRGCSGCEKGKVEQLAYLPIFVYKHGPLSTILNVPQTPDVEILKMSVVRTNAPQNAFVESPNVRREGSLTKAQMKDEVQDERAKMAVEAFIRKYMEGQGNAHVVKLFRQNSVYFVTTTSKYCENLQREHGSNHVWFIVSGKQILQKCFCECPTLVGRRDGFCKDFCGRRHELTRDVLELLYPNREDVKKCVEVKKKAAQPKMDQLAARTAIEAFARRWMRGQGDAIVVGV